MSIQSLNNPARRDDAEQAGDRPVISVAGQRSALGTTVRRALAVNHFEVHAAGADSPAPVDAASPSVLVMVSQPALPADGTRSAWFRYRRGRLRERAEDLARRAMTRGATSLVAVSSALLYGAGTDDRSGGALSLDPPPETVAAEATEAAARVFSGLGGRSVVLRLGWTYGERERLTRQVLDAARKGWQVLDGPAGTYLPTVEIGDAAAAVLAALNMPPGTYDVTDGQPRTQSELSEAMAEGLGRSLHPLSEAHWGHGRLLGRSRRLHGTDFTQSADWSPLFPDARERFRILSANCGNRII
jgi:hypothetical protein